MPEIRGSIGQLDKALHGEQSLWALDPGILPGLPKRPWLLKSRGRHLSWYLSLSLRILWSYCASAKNCIGICWMINLEFWELFQKFVFSLFQRKSNDTHAAWCCRAKRPGPRKSKDNSLLMAPPAILGATCKWHQCGHACAFEKHRKGGANDDTLDLESGTSMHKLCQGICGTKRYSGFRASDCLNLVWQADSTSIRLKPKLSWWFRLPTIAPISNAVWC